MQNFLSEVLAEKIRTGDEIQPDLNNRVAKHRKHVFKQIQDTADKTGKSENAVAWDYLESNRPTIERFVMTNGEMPQKDIVGLSKQAAIIRAQQVQNIAGTLDVDTATAESFLEDSEAQQLEMNSSDADNFIGHTVGAMQHAFPKADNITVTKSNDPKKAANILGVVGDVIQFGLNEYGKIKSGDFSDKNGQDYPGADGKIKAKDVANTVYDNVVAQQKSAEIKKMLPLIILGVVALIVVTVLIARKK